MIIKGRGLLKPTLLLGCTTAAWQWPGAAGASWGAAYHEGAPCVGLEGGGVPVAPTSPPAGPGRDERTLRVLALGQKLQIASSLPDARTEQPAGLSGVMLRELCVGPLLTLKPLTCGTWFPNKDAGV